MNLSIKKYFAILLGIIVFNIPVLFSQTGQYDVRFVQNFDNCVPGQLFVDMEVKATNSSSNFNVSDMNFRFSFNRDAVEPIIPINPPLANPPDRSVFIQDELTLSGFVQKYGLNSFYNAHTLTGSNDTIVSYNVSLAGGDGYPLDEIDWVKVGRLRFQLKANAQALVLRWHTHDLVDFPPTFVGEKLTGVLYESSEGVYHDLPEIDFAKEVFIKVFLEGPYELGQSRMSTKLNTARSILPGQTPTSSLVNPTPSGNPYRDAPWNYTGTTEEESYAGPYQNDLGIYVVDWILVSFRTSPSKGDEIIQSNALLFSDGSVQFIDSTILVGLDECEIWIVIEHRNHMGVMSDSAVTVQNYKLTYDFTIANSFRTPTSFGQKQIEPGTFVMYAGDSDQGNDFPSYDINGLDNIVWTIQNGVFDIYLPGDFNLNGDVNGADIILWSNNNGISSSVPKN